MSTGCGSARSVSGEVFTTQAVSRIMLFLIAGLAGGGLVFASLLLAYRSRPVFVPTNDVDPLAPYRTIVTTRPKLFAFGDLRSGRR